MVFPFFSIPLFTLRGLDPLGHLASTSGSICLRSVGFGCVVPYAPSIRRRYGPEACTEKHDASPMCVHFRAIDLPEQRCVMF